jgi:ferredoxin-NADP reductase/MOSC domain-containing protein YiiM
MDTLVSVNVGLPQDVEWNGRTIRTSIWKSPVRGRVVVRRLNIDGDRQTDLVGHGGEQRAVLVYQRSSYRHWSAYFDGRRFDLGQFGENLTVEGLEDDVVCIGDRYGIGGAIFEVTQPRVTCYRLGLRMNVTEMPALLVSHHRPGFYMRVIAEGDIGAGDRIVKLADGPERMSVAEVDALLYTADHPEEKLRRVLRIGALSRGWRRSFEALLGAALKGVSDENAGLGPAQGGAAAWEGFRPLRVAAIAQESEDVRSFVLAAPDGSALPAFRPGQHVAIRLRSPDGSSGVTRLYSLSGSASSGTYRISVKRERPGSASDRLHSSVQVDAVIDVSSPRGDFLLVDADRPVALVSAGVGVTPMVALLHALAESPAGRRREVWWLHGARDGLHHAFRAEAAGLLAKLPAGHGHVTYSRPLAQDAPHRGFDDTGHLTIDTVKALGVPQGADFYLCGPDEFMTQLTRQLRDWGVDAWRIHVEVFGAVLHEGTGGAPAPVAHPPPEASSDGPSVNFARSGLKVNFSSRYRSVLELAEACDVPVRWSCRTGVCQSCRTPLLDGAVIYQPEPLASPAAGTVLLCCARPVADIELDL